MEVYIEVGGDLHESRSNGSRWTLMEILWKQLEVCYTRESRWKYLGVYVSSWKLPRNIFVEASIDDSGKFHVFPWKLPLTSTEANPLRPTSMTISMEQIHFHRLPWK